MIPLKTRKKLIKVFGSKGMKQDLEKLKILKEAIDIFDSYDKADVEWLMDGIWGEEVNLNDMAKEMANMYEKLSDLRRQKWGDNYEP